MSEIDRNNSYIDIKFCSYDSSMLDRSVRCFMESVDKTDLIIKGPIPLPTKRKVFTVNRSPHVYKNSREHFGVFSYFRLLRIKGSNHLMVGSLHDMDLPPGVDVRIKIYGN